MFSDGGAQLVGQLLDVAVLGDPVEGLLQVPFGLRPEAHLQVEAGRLPVNRPVLGVEPQGRLDGLHAPARLPGEAAADEGEVVQGLRVLSPVVDGEVELLERADEVPFAIRLDALGEVDLRHGGRVERRAPRPLVEVEVVGLPALRVRQDVDGLGEDLETHFRLRLLRGVREPVRVGVPRQRAEAVADHRIDRVTAHPEDLVVVRHGVPVDSRLSGPLAQSVAKFSHGCPPKLKGREGARGLGAVRRPAFSGRSASP